MIIRAEQKTDHEAVRQVNLSAFETPSEADLVESLREQAESIISLVVEEDGKILGHIMFSPVTAAHNNIRIMGLAPMAVIPEYQGHGIGSAMIQAGLDECRKTGVSAVVVLGHPKYYPRFGFMPSTRFGIRSEYEVPEEVFMAIELSLDALKEINGVVRYHPAFNNL